MAGYDYEPREQQGARPKHKWANLHAGVIEGRGGVLVGMCAGAITIDLARTLLNDGIFYYPPGWKEDHPASIFNVHDGVPYRAVRTNPGRSYHGFPCISARRDIPPGIRPQLVEKAVRLGCADGLREWFESYP